MDAPVFLHAAHQVRTAIDELRLVSWLAIGLGIGALVLTWGKLLAWIRTPEQRGPAVMRWGEDAAGWWVEIARGGARRWWIETDRGENLPLRPSEGADPALRPEVFPDGRPTALVADDGVRLRL